MQVKELKKRDKVWIDREISIDINIDNMIIKYNNIYK
jgi:hypothetical protein